MSMVGLLVDVPEPGGTSMPYVNIKVTREGGTSREQKSALIHGVTDLLAKVLDKSPDTTIVVIDEVEMGNWGIGGLPVVDHRRRVKKVQTHRRPQIYQSHQ